MFPSFGGSGLDRLIDFMPDDGMGGDGAGAAAAPDAGTADPGVPAEPSTADPAAAFAWSPDNPEFLEAVAQQAAEIADARVQPILELLQQAAAGSPGAQQQMQQFDWGSLNALEDDFGPQLGNGINAAVTQALTPVYQFMQQMIEGQQTFEQQQQKQAGDNAANDWITRNAPADLPDVAKNLIRPLAQQVFPKYAALYGHTDRAGDAAFREALNTVQQIRSDGTQQAAVDHVTHLATVNGARVEPGSGGSGVVTFPDKPLKGPQIVQKYSASAAALRGY